MHLQIEEPVGANEFTVCDEIVNAMVTKLIDKAFDEVDSLVGIGVTLFIEKPPHHRNSNALIDHTQHQNIDIVFANLPVRAVDGQAPRFWNLKDGDNQLCQRDFIPLKVSKEPLHPFIA